MYKPNDITYPLISWYNSNRRELPWRSDYFNKNSPYYVLVSEFMLQQTTVSTVIGYFEKFISIWPTLYDLSNASENEVIQAWSGLGYYSRATNLLKTSQIIANEFSHEIPKNIEILKKLPGIGEYMSSSIVSIAYDLPSRAVDTNIQRVLTRYFHLDYSNPSINRKNVENLVEELTCSASPRDVVQALMDLGSSICSVNNPSCDVCPIREHCKANSKNNFDFRNNRDLKSLPKRYGNVFVIKNKVGEYLISKRPDKGILAKTYQFPTTDWVNDQNYKKLITNFSKKNIRQIGIVNHRFSHFQLQLKVIEIPFSDYQLLDNYTFQNSDWVALKNIGKLGLSSLMRKVLKLIKD
ncbi:MAG: A/G-specific adenine glycosylase [Hyphomicrobiales bacterium]